MPLQKKIVENWKFSCLGFETNAKDEVTLIFCKVCREFSKIEDIKCRKKGVAKVSTETFVKGTSVIKKNNFHDHILKSQTHATAVLRVSEKGKENNESSSSNVASTVASGAPKQTTLMPYIQRINSQQRKQLISKMQIAHFTVSNAKSFSFYEKISKFCADTLNVSLC